MLLCVIYSIQVLGGGSTKTPNYQNYGQCLSGLGTGIQKSVSHLVRSIVFLLF